MCMASVLAIYGKMSILRKPFFLMFLNTLGYSKVVVTSKFKKFIISLSLSGAL